MKKGSGIANSESFQKFMVKILGEYYRKVIITTVLQLYNCIIITTSLLYNCSWLLI